MVFQPHDGPVLISSDHLIDQARILAGRPAARRPRQVDLRRALSAAYYAVFHEIAGIWARQVFTAEQAMLRERAAPMLDHRCLADACRAWQTTPLPVNNARLIPPGAASLAAPDLAATQKMAKIVLDLQKQRHLADYDPGFTTSRTNTMALVNDVWLVIQHLRTVTVFIFSVIAWETLSPP